MSPLRKAQSHGIRARMCNRQRGHCLRTNLQPIRRRQVVKVGDSHNGRAIFRRQRLDARLRCARTDDDRTGLSAFLRRACQKEECAGHYDAELRVDGRDYSPMGALRLQLSFLGRHTVLRQLHSCASARRRHPAECGLRRNDSAADLHAVSTDVRNHHACADNGRVRRAHEI